MFSRLRNYFMQFSKQDWELVGYIVIIVLMVLLMPAVWFWDYVHTPNFYWRSWYWQRTLTESLQNWWVWVLDKLRGLW